MGFGGGLCGPERGGGRGVDCTVGNSDVKGDIAVLEVAVEEGDESLWV